MPMTQIHTDDFIVEVIRSKRRKTLALAVRDATVTIRMPDKLPLRHAEKFIAQKTSWIKQKLASQSPPPQRRFCSGELLPYLGRSLSLDVAPAAKNNLVFKEAGSLSVKCRSHGPSSASLSRQITGWYRQQAEHYLTSRCQQLAELTGLRPRSVKVKSYKARWGSCHIRGDIQLNWKLMMAPPAVIDYVIIHELCHLQQHNHSAAFWNLVGFFDPNFTRHRAWLKKNGQQLQL